MTKTNETIADIIAEMRGGPIHQHRRDQELLRHFSDRLEAAWKREKATIEADALAAPPKNCDEFRTKDKAREAFQKLRGHRVWADVSLWDNRNEIEAFIDWLYAPATEKEGGKK